MLISHLLSFVVMNHHVMPTSTLCPETLPSATPRMDVLKRKSRAFISLRGCGSPRG